MKETETLFTCDRCGETAVYDGYLGNNMYLHNNAGWRRVTVGSYVYDEKKHSSHIRTGSPMYRDLCRLCYTDFIGFIEMDKPTHAIVE